MEEYRDIKRIFTGLVILIFFFNQKMLRKYYSF